MQYIRPPSTTTQFDPVGAIGRGYQTGANIMADIDTTRERKRQEQARNYFGPAVGGDTQSLTKLAQSSPQLAKMAVDVKTYIDQTDNPEELKLTANQMKIMAGAVKAGMAAPDQWPKVQNILAQALNKSPEEIGGVDQAGFYYNMLAGGVGEASKKLDEVQSSEILAGGAGAQVVTKGGKTTVVPLTPEQQAIVREAEEREVKLQQMRAQGRKLGGAAAKKAGVLLDKSEKIRSNNLKLKDVITQVKAGAETGAIANRLPSFKAATRRLIQIRNELGLDVIGSVTFGALSEGELRLALDTAVDLGLEGPKLVEWAENKISAQEKLLDYFEEQALFLSEPGKSEADWARQIKEKQTIKQEGQSVIQFDRQGNRL